MAPQFFSSSIIFFLFSLSSLYYIAHAHYFPSSAKLPSPLHFLKDMKGTQKGDLAEGVSELKKYLTKLGYIDVQNNPMQGINDLFDDTLESAIKKYQKFYNLNVTGVLDQETVDQLQQPRCGVADFHSHVNASLFLHNVTDMGSLYTFLGTKWPAGKRNLSFSFPQNTSTDAKYTIFGALFRWKEVSPFSFFYKSDLGKADVKISFQRRNHGDGSPFDGPNGILAHAFPPTDGRLHFDADESWRTTTAQGKFDLKSVALHELGHILGLGHSTDRKAVMYAYFGAGETRGLNDDDIRGIHALYPK